MPAYMAVEPFDAFPKEFHIRRKNACGSHSMWHRSCRREGYQDKVSSVKPGSPGRNQCQGVPAAFAIHSNGKTE